jgi:hypothetical protein
MIFSLLSYYCGIIYNWLSAEHSVNAVLPGPTRSEGVEEFVAKLSDGKSFEEFETEFFQTIW